MAKTKWRANVIITSTRYDEFGEEHTIKGHIPGDKDSLYYENRWLKGDDFLRYINKKLYKWLNSGAGHTVVSNEVRKQLGIKGYKYTDVEWNDEKYTSDAEINGSNILSTIKKEERRLTRLLCDFAPKEKKGSVEHGVEAKENETADPIFTSSDIIFTEPICRDGKWYVNMCFKEGSLERDSITGKKDKKNTLQNIIHLYQTGVDKKKQDKYAYGYSGSNMRRHYMYKNDSGYVQHKSKIDPKGKDTRMRSYPLDKSELDDLDFLERAVHLFNVYNRYRIGAYAKLTGSYVPVGRMELSWDKVTHIYNKSWKGLSREETIEARRSLYLSSTRLKK